MAARKENHVIMASQAPSGRITRAQAAGSRSRVGVSSIPLPMKTEQMQAVKGKTKRGPSDQSSGSMSGPQPKRHTVLKDVMNTSRANSNTLQHYIMMSSWCNYFPQTLSVRYNDMVISFSHR
jgi:cyclin-A